MKKIYKKIIFVCFTIILGVLISGTKTDAANASLSASSQNVNVGDNVTIKVDAYGCLSNLIVSGPGVSGRIDIVSTDLSNQSDSKTYTLDTSSAGSKTITLSGNIVDADRTQVPINQTITVNVVAKQNNQQQSNQQQQQQQPAQNQQQNQQPAQQQPAEPTFTSTNQTVYAAKEGINVRASYSTSSKAIGSLKQGQSVTRTGIGSNGWSRVTYNGQTAYISSSLLTTNKPAEPEDNKEDKDKEEKKKEEEKKEENQEKSTNKALKDIVVENYKLTPDFDPETTKYSLEVTKDVEELEITPIVQDDKAKFDIQGNENFKVGNNIVRITVTAEDGTTRIYSITVTKTNEAGDEEIEENGLKLKKLQINNATLEPSFNPDVTSYNITVSDPSAIKVSDIIAETEDEDINVTIAEAEANKNGERVITIMLENSDGTQSAVYQVTIKKSVFNPIAEIKKNTDKKIYFILGGIIGILLIAIIVIIILLKKTSNTDDIQDIKEADELSDDYDYSLKNAIDQANATEEETPKYDEMVENADIKSQILNTEEYNVFDDEGDGVGVSDETKRFDLNDDDKPTKPKKKGKHF